MYRRAWPEDSRPTGSRSVIQSRSSASQGSRSEPFITSNVARRSRILQGGCLLGAVSVPGLVEQPRRRLGHPRQPGLLGFRLLLFLSLSLLVWLVVRSSSIHQRCPISPSLASCYPLKSSFTEARCRMTFLDVYPVVLLRCRLIHGTPEEKEELTAEAVCVALDDFRSLERRGKTASPKSIAYYAVMRACSGRKIATSDHKRDAMHRREKEAPCVWDVPRWSHHEGSVPPPPRFPRSSLPDSQGTCRRLQRLHSMTSFPQTIEHRHQISPGAFSSDTKPDTKRMKSDTKFSKFWTIFPALSTNKKSRKHLQVSGLCRWRIRGSNS
jgi:hypothetical protein